MSITLVQRHDGYRLLYIHRTKVYAESHTDSRKPKGMHPSEIKAALMFAGKTQSEIAESIKRNPSRVNAVVNNNSKCLKIRKAIAGVLEKDVKDIWPNELHRKPNGRIVEPLAQAA